MIKIKRTTQKIFGGNAPADDIAIMGSFKSGTPVYTDDVEKLQNTVYEEGYGSAIISNVAPFMEEQNSVPYVLSKQLAYLFQEGIPEFDKDTEYYIGSICKYGGVLFTSVSDNNKGHQPDSDDGTNWTTLSAGGGGGLEVCDIGMSLFVDETKGLRRRLNGQIVNINANNQYFLTRLKQITTLYPTLRCTEEQWQAAKTLSVYGQVGRFVFNYASDGVTVESVRLPAVVNVQGLMDLANTGLTVSAGFPTLYTNSTGAHTHDRGSMNITGTVSGGELIRTDNEATMTGAFHGTLGPNKRPIGENGASYVINFDASRSWTGVTSTNGEHSHSIAGTSNTVQPEAIQYPYFIQIATGQETEADIVNTIELNNPNSLFDCKFADHKLDNLSWLRSSESGQYNDGSVYSDAYNELISEYNNAESVEETDNGITYKRTPKGYKIALDDQKTAIDNLYSSSGVAWFYVINQTTQQFVLPRTKFGFNGIRNKVGDYISESLPNITANFQMPIAVSGASASGAISIAKVSVGTSVPAGYQTNAQGAYYESGVGLVQYNLDASRSSSAFQNNKGVQQRGTEMYLYFYVGETIQNSKLIDAGRIAEELVDLKATKADKTQVWTLSHVGKTKTALAWGASGSKYAAPANGRFAVEYSSTNANEYIRFYHQKNDINRTSVGNPSGALSVDISVDKGDEVTLYHNVSGYPLLFHFVPANGG